MIEQHLKNFLANQVDPTPGIIEQANSSQEWLRGVLAEKFEAKKNLPDLLTGQAFLFGSAIRGTKNAPFDDVDFMLVLDGSNLVAMEAGIVVGTAYGSGKNYNKVLLPQYLYANGLVSSKKVLDQIRAVVAETYPRSEIRKDGQAINIWMESYGFGIDVVPAFKISSSTVGDHYYIPRGTGSDEWLKTNPHADLNAFQMEDLRLNGLLRPTARLMRKWNELCNASRLSGFHIDALTYHSLKGKTIDTHEVAILNCLSHFEGFLGGTCPQFSTFQPHIDHKLSADNRLKSISAVKRAKDVIFPAVTGGLPNEILGGWNGLFAEKLLI